MPFVFAEYSLVLAMASVRRTPACLNACQVIDRRLRRSLGPCGTEPASPSITGGRQEAIPAGSDYPDTSFAQMDSRAPRRAGARA